MATERMVGGAGSMGRKVTRSSPWQGFLGASEEEELTRWREAGETSARSDWVWSRTSTMGTMRIILIAMHF